MKREKDEKIKLDGFCEVCGKKYTNIRKNRSGKFVCWKCYCIDYPVLSIGLLGKTRINYQKAIERIYEVKGYKRFHNGCPTFYATLSVPSILIGHKVKLVPIEKEGDRKIVRTKSKILKNKKEVKK